MDYEESMKLFDLIRQAGNNSDEDWKKLYNDFLEQAVNYATARTRFYFVTPKEIGEANNRRTELHDSFITSIHTLVHHAKSNGYDALWATILERDRRDLGDFASFIHAIIGIGRR